MSFKFDWSPFLINSTNIDSISSALSRALNRGPKSPAIVGETKLKNLQLGHAPPALHLIEISDITDDSFRGRFRVDYNGDASISLQTFVEANSLRLFTKGLSSFISPTSWFQGSTKSLVLPLDFTISDVRLSGEVSVVMSKTKGATVVFQGSPLRSVEIHSSLDFLPGASDMIKQEINDELVLMFSDYIPDMIYKLSLENNPEASAFERSLVDLMIASKDPHDRTVVFSKDRRFSFLSDALLNSNSLKSVSAIRNSAQTLSLAETFVGTALDYGIVHSRACLSNVLINCTQSMSEKRKASTSSSSEDSKVNTTPPIQASTLQQPARKQRRVISLRKNFNASSESKNSSLSSGATTPQQLPSKYNSQNSNASSRRNSQIANKTIAFSHPSSPITKSAPISRVSSLSESASAPASILSSPRSAAQQHRLRPPNTPDPYYLQHQPHDITKIPLLDFSQTAPVTTDCKSKQTTKHKDYVYRLKRESHQQQQQHNTAGGDSLNYYKTRTKRNVVTPNQIFSQSSSTTATAAANVNNDVVIVGDDHPGKTGEPFYNVGSVSFNIPPPIYR